MPLSSAWSCCRKTPTQSLRGLRVNWQRSRLDGKLTEITGSPFWYATVTSGKCHTQVENGEWQRNVFTEPWEWGFGDTVFCAALESKNCAYRLFLPASEYAQYTCELNIKYNKTLSITQYHVAQSDNNVIVQTFLPQKNHSDWLQRGPSRGQYNCSSTCWIFLWVRNHLRNWVCF